MQKLSKLRINAFTLIEVMVAMVVLAIGLLGLAGITVVVLRSNTLSQQISEATTLSSDLMDTLKRQAIGNLPNCPTANAYTASAVTESSNCNIIYQSGLKGLGDGYMPVTNRTDAGCVVTGSTILQTSGSTPALYDVVAANFLVMSDSGLATNFCGASSFSLSPRSYIRYYRTYQPSSGNAGDRTIVVGVLWKDRFGRWRNVHLSTTRTN